MISEKDTRFGKLTPTERTVLVHLCDGLINKVIADKMSVTPHTIKFHIDNIMKKLHVDTRTGAAVTAIRNGLVP